MGGTENSSGYVKLMYRGSSLPPQGNIGKAERGFGRRYIFCSFVCNIFVKGDSLIPGSHPMDGAMSRT